MADPSRPIFSTRTSPAMDRIRSGALISVISGRQKVGSTLPSSWTYFSRRIDGLATSDRLKRDLALKALHRALATRQPPAGFIHHSDRGSQYCSDDYQRLLKRAGMVPSMSGKGNCYVNAMVETVFKTIKSELVWRTSFQTRRHAEIAIGHYIDGFYNPRRRHSALGYRSPVAFEVAMANTE